LSISTVSRALKDHPDISAATKAKVNALANSLDYEPNAYAIQLRTQNSKIFGVIVPAISNLFYDSFISAVEEESRKNGYALMILQSSNQVDIELDNLKKFRNISEDDRKRNTCCVF
jgi:LacI family transcriptional regulator